MKAMMTAMSVWMVALGLALGMGGEKARAAEPVVELPGWVKSLTLKGDLRLRYQYEEREEGPGAGLEAGTPRKSRQRPRFRFRLGFNEKVSDTVTTAFGLASGNGDPRSTNQTLDNSFEKPDIRIDFANVVYKKPLPGGHEFSAEGGLFPVKDLVWAPGDVIWDPDFSLGGVMTRLKKSGPNWDASLALGALSLDEIGTTTRNSKAFKDPMLFMAQIPFSRVFGEATKLTAAVAYYNFDNVYNHVLLDHRAGTNSSIDLDGSGPLTIRGSKYDFDSVGFGLAAEQIPAGPFYLSLYGEYLKNPDIAKDIEAFLAANPGYSEPADFRKRDTAYIAGLRFGHGGLKVRGQWQVAYNYRGLGKDAWPDNFPDSDSYGGGTGIQGHEASGFYVLGKGVVLGLDYYRLQKITVSTEKERDHLFQIDLVTAF